MASSAPNRFSNHGSSVDEMSALTKSITLEHIRWLYELEPRTSLTIM